jgi:crossover junction endodeoxyribonuclease RuvC
MLVIGIDPGTARTGYGIVRQSDDGSLTAVEFGVIVTDSEQALPQRLLLISKNLADLLLRHRPDSGAMEKLFIREHVSTALSVGQASGAALLTLAEADVPAYEYSPLEVKQAICGYGQADKTQVQEMVKALLGLEERPSPDDAADALAVAICHLHTAAVISRLEAGS